MLNIHAEPHNGRLSFTKKTIYSPLIVTFVWILFLLLNFECCIYCYTPHSSCNCQ